MSERKDDGGCAFPMPGSTDPNGNTTYPEFGMRLRDWFAGQALAGFLADGSQRKIAHHIEHSADAALIQDDRAKTAVINGLIAEGVYLLADAMLAERSK